MPLSHSTHTHASYRYHPVDRLLSTLTPYLAIIHTKRASHQSPDHLRDSDGTLLFQDCVGLRPSPKQRENQAKRVHMVSRAKPPLTGLYVFMATKREEQQESSRTAPMSEMLQLWKALPEAERKEFEERANEEQKRYMNDCIAKYEQKQSDAAEEAEGEEEELATERIGAEELAVQLPLARVMKIIKLNNEIVKIGRDASFLVAKATEQFLERATWDAARATIRTQRKTIAHRDVVTSMREHPNPESMQIFVEELQAQSTDPPAPPPVKPKATKKRPAKTAAGPKAGGQEGATSKAPPQLPPKKMAKKS